MTSALDICGTSSCHGGHFFLNMSMVMMFKELLSLPVTFTIQTRVYRRHSILLFWTHVPCNTIIKRRALPMRLSRIFFSGGGGGGGGGRGPGPTARKQSGQRVFCFFLQGVQMLISIETHITRDFPGGSRPPTPSGFAHDTLKQNFPIHFPF